jgi:hypothetical protein
MSEAAARYFAKLVQFAEADSEVLGLAITGSMAVGFEAPESDYDCTLFVVEGTEATVRARLDPLVEGVDLALFTPSSFAAHARWGSSTAWDRYAWWIADFLVDRTGGQLVAAAREKGRVPEEHMEAYVDSSLDWYLNQIARSIRCLARGDAVGGRLEAAESVRPLLQASFAIHDRRLVPYYKFLGWELAERPLERFHLSSQEFVESVYDLVVVGSLEVQAKVLALTEPVFRASGYARRFDEWKTVTWWRLYFDQAST